MWCRALIRNFYREDLEIYGYDLDDPYRAAGEPIRQQQWLSPQVLEEQEGLSRGLRRSA